MKKAQAIFGSGCFANMKQSGECSRLFKLEDA